MRTPVIHAGCRIANFTVSSGQNWRYREGSNSLVAEAIEQPIKTMTHALARTLPFTGNVLDGFTPSVPHIRYPVTIGLYEEGPNLGLFIAPVDLRLIQAVTHELLGDNALVLPGAAVLDDAFMAAPEPPRIIGWSDVHTEQGDLDLIHLPAGLDMGPDAIDIPTPVLAAPEQAVPVELGSRLAVGFNDRCHAAFISPDPLLIQQVLTGFVEAYAAAASATETVPSLTAGLLAPLLEPMKVGDWKELRFVERKRYWMLEAANRGQHTPSHRWVTEGPDGHWRLGWSWG